MKLIFGDSASIAFRDEHIIKQYEKKASFNVDEIAMVMEKNTKNCACYQHNEFKERFSGFKIKLVGVKEGSKKLIWWLKCSILLCCVFPGMTSSIHDQNMECICEKEVITDLDGNIIKGGLNM